MGTRMSVGTALPSSTMPEGYTATPGPVLLDASINADITVDNASAGPGNATTVWTQPRDFEVDMQTVLLAALAHYGITDVPVLINGVYEPSQLRNAQGQVVPVITITMQSDVGTRTSIGELTGTFDVNSTQIQDGIPGDPTATPPIPTIIEPILPSTGTVTLKNQASTVSLDMSVYALDETLAKTTYFFCKTVLFAAEQTFADLGYINPPLRTAASRSTNILDADGGQKFLFEWTMTYQAMHYDFIAGVDALATIVGARANITTSDVPADTGGPIQETMLFADGTEESVVSGLEG